MRTSALLTAVLLTLPLFACRDQSASETVIRPVKVVVARIGEEPPSAPLAGQVAAHTQVNAAFRAAGKISERLVSAGDRVRRGQVLARLDDAVLRDNLAAAKADVAAAEAALAQSRQHAARADRLVRERAMSKNEQEVARRQFRAAQAQLDAARAKRHAAAEQLDHAVLTAPVSGLVTERLAERGEVAAAGQPVFRIAGDDGRDALFDLPESLLAELKTGDRLQVCLDSRRDICSDAVLYEIAPDADRTTRTYRAKARISDPAAMPLGATLLGRPLASAATTDAENAGPASFRLPAAALVRVDGKPSVWILDEAKQTVHLRPVTVLGYGKDSVLVSGLRQGELVAAAGAQTLREGQKARRLRRAGDAVSASGPSEEPGSAAP